MEFFNGLLGGDRSHSKEKAAKQILLGTYIRESLDHRKEEQRIFSFDIDLKRLQQSGSKSEYCIDWGQKNIQKNHPISSCLTNGILKKLDLGLKGTGTMLMQLVNLMAD